MGQMMDWPFSGGTTAPWFQGPGPSIMVLSIEWFRSPSLSTRLSFLHPNHQITHLLAFRLSHRCISHTSTMASTNLTDENAVNNILTFGRYYQTMVAMEPDVVFDDRSVLHPEEASFIQRIAIYDDSTAARTCRKRLDLPLDYYYAVKHQITSFQRVWDAVLEEKRRYDAVGWLGGSRNFMDCFQLCSYLVPQRVSIGFLGPRDPNFENASMNHPACYQSGASTVVNSPTRYAEYETSIPDRDHGERFLSDEEEYLDALALSPTDSDESFEDIDQDGRPEIISLSSDEDDSGSEYSDGSDGSDGSTDDNRQLQYRLELDGGNVPNSGPGEAGPIQSEGDLADALWERLFGNLPDTQHPSEKAQGDESVGEQHRVPKLGRPLSRELEDVPKKRKTVHDSDARGKRQRTS